MFGRSTHGLIGVDIGSTAIKVAQLRRRGDTFALTAAAVCPRSSGGDSGLAGAFKAMRSLAEGLQGSRVAAILSMQQCGLEATAEPEAREADRCYGSWQASDDQGYTLHTPLSDVEAVVEGCVAAGLQCEVLDGAPLAVARATPIGGGDLDELVGAIDWGERAVTFVASQRGQAKYVRRLASDGFAATRAAVSESLGLNDSEANTAISRHGLSAESPAGRLIAEAIRKSIRPTLTELSKTLNHLGAKLKTRGPERLTLLGGAATTPGLGVEVTRRLERPASVWAPEGVSRSDEASTPGCLLGSAIALSALAWEGFE